MYYFECIENSDTGSKYIINHIPVDQYIINCLFSGETLLFYAIDISHLLRQHYQGDFFNNFL